mmetsp:Transcript_41435/g.81233  ORF Transcript_41435/g.81233 Transcript_41435/m.81233 type:complete len:508 (+) Transcript_41435:70-1593(+)|eukprot:CAMPEP_0175131652 /NCGR_PEP_ID=MMETSP0087-20121206/6660_1 /TAXON_ID=136419 /ORGANISM="Unknown Unknown, Strain D1" /LENGTH=507 /DNA_ID=CAMNT_0016413963 /DNA_START=165 /DNA_END=1688 /DNA_ORIENTATION=+
MSTFSKARKTTPPRNESTGVLALNTTDSDDDGKDDYTCHNCGQLSDPCHLSALRTFIRNFGIAFGIRAGFSVTLRAFTLLRSNPRNFFNLDHLLGEKNLVVRTEAVRWGLFFGIMSGGFSMFHCICKKIFGEGDSRSSLVAGALSSVCLLAHPPTRRRELSLYVFVRLLQCLYNESKRRYNFTPLKHGDGLLFMVTSAQIMYAYVMRPETLPETYWNFIVRTGPIEKPVLSAVRNSIRGNSLDVDQMVTFLNKKGVPEAQEVMHNLGSLPDLIPCSILHPLQQSCTKNTFGVLVSAFKKLFPLHMTVTFVPLLVVGLFRVLRRPWIYGTKGVLSAARSTLFLSSFCASYQGLVCMARNTGMAKDSKFLFWISGFLSSLSIFIERKSRRAELSLYALPRAGDSLFMILCDYQWMRSFRHGEFLLFGTALSGLMYFYHEHQHRTMSPMVNGVFNFLFSRTKVFPDDEAAAYAQQPASSPNAPVLPAPPVSDKSSGSGSERGSLKRPQLP